MVRYFNNEIESHFLLDRPIWSYIILNIETESHYRNMETRVDF